MKNTQKFLFIPICFILLINTINSQTIIPAGEVYGVWTKANSPYIIEGNVTIPSDRTLEIEPGVKVESNGALSVYGKLLAIGEHDDSIIFTKKIGSPYWLGIRYFGNDTYLNDSSKFIFCIFEYGHDLDGKYAGAFSIYKSNILISNCTFKRNTGWYYSALGIQYCNPKIINTKFYENDGVFVYRAFGIYPELELKNCIFAHNKGTIVVEDFMLMSNCLIYNNVNIWLWSCKIKNSIIRSNRDLTIYNRRDNYYIEIDHCNFEYGTDSINGDKSRLIFSNNIDYPPLFKDPDSYDFSLLKSACINSGDPNTSVEPYELDLAGNPRIYQDGENIIDIGPYEYQGTKPNRTSYVRVADTIDIVKSTRRKLYLNFKDPDINDKHTFSALSDNPKVNISIIGPTDTSFIIDIIPEENYTGISKITYSITDNSGSDNATFYDTIQVKVSNLFSGVITGEVFLKDTIFITGNIIVDKGSILNIGAGSTLLFQGWYKIDVYGRLYALGEANNRIEFNAIDTTETSEDTFRRENGWAGMNFIDVKNSDTIYLRNCNIKNTGKCVNDYMNSTIHISNSQNILIDSCSFYGNYTIYSARNVGVSIENSQNILINNSIFSHGRGVGYGAYINADGSIVHVDNCIFDTILSSDTRRHASNVFDSGSSTVTIKNCEFKNIEAGTLIYLSGNNIFENNIIHDNKGTVLSGNGIIRNNIFYNNLLNVNAVVNCGSSSSVITGNLFYNNFLDCNCSNFIAVAISLSGNALVMNNTFVNNRQTSNGNVVYANYCSPTIINNIFWNNSNEGFGYYNGAGVGVSDPIYKNNLVKNGNSPNFNFDPMFKSIENNDFQLAINSSAINKALMGDYTEYLPELDIKGNKRIDFTTELLDLGAYEYVIENSPPSGLNLQKTSIYNKTTQGSFISKIIGTDPNSTQRLSYQLFLGDGLIDADNNKFFIRNDSLFINENVDFQLQNLYKINLAVNDGKGGQLVKTFQLSVLNEILSVNDEFENNTKIYPNPVSNVLIIDSKDNYELKITNTNGNTIYVQKLSIGKNEIDLSGIINGTYFIELAGKNKLVKKIIKI